PSSDAARARMLATRRRDTMAELAVRSAAHKLGLRFQLDRQPIPDVRSRADLLFPTERVAVFIDGCFWHSCPKHGTIPRANGLWWRQKLDENRARDHRVGTRLRESG